MKIVWDVSGEDIRRLNAYMDQHRNWFVEKRASRNLQRTNSPIDRNSLIKSLLICLMTPVRRTETDHRISMMLLNEPFHMDYEELVHETNVAKKLKELLQVYGLTRHLDKVPNWFTTSFCNLENTEWELIEELSGYSINPPTRDKERELADRIDRMFKGFGSSRARMFLQNLGITRYEIPIDMLTIRWMKEFSFPVSISLKALQDIGFYHMVSDGIQILCEKADIYPVLLDAAIISDSIDLSLFKNHIIS